MKDWIKIVRLVAQYGQLGFTIVTPPVVLALAASALQRRFSMGSWIIVVGIVLGLLAAAAGVYQFYRRLIALEKKEEGDHAVIFYKHE